MTMIVSLCVIFLYEHILEISIDDLLEIIWIWNFSRKQIIADRLIKCKSEVSEFEGPLGFFFFLRKAFHLLQFWVVNNV